MLNFECSNYLVVPLPITFYPLTFTPNSKLQTPYFFGSQSFTKILNYARVMSRGSSYELRVTVLGYRLSVLDSRVTLHELRFPSHESRVTLLASLRSAPPRVASRKRIKKRSTKLLSYD